MTHPALEPGRIGPLHLRNRIVKTATFEGMTPQGRVTSRLVEHHAAFARRKVGLSTVAYGAVEREGRTFEHQLVVDGEARDGLARLARAVHREGGAVSLQLSHCGGFTKVARPVKGPSPGFNPYGIAAGRGWVRAMEEADLDRVEAAFVRAATVARDAGFDAVELHLGHGYLLSQFLSPVLNRRRDRYGGDLEGRLRFPLRVVTRVVDAVADRLAVLCKINVDDGVAGGLDPAEAAQVAVALEAAGVHGIVTSGGLVQRSAFFLLRGEVPLRAMARHEDGLLQRWAMRGLGRIFVPSYPWSPGFFLESGRHIVEAVRIPVVALGGLDGAHTLRRAAEAGYRFFALGRALLADPDFVERLERGEEPTSRCDHCNLCVAAMDEGVRCVRFERPKSAEDRARRAATP